MALKNIILLSTEQQTVESSIGFEDATGVLSAVVASVNESIIQLQRIATYMPAGSNLTALNTAITALQAV